MSELRQRKSTNLLEPFRELDAFKMNKLPEEIEQKSSLGENVVTEGFHRLSTKLLTCFSGGTVSLLSRLLIAFVIYKEIQYYLETSLVFKFVPDADIQSKLKFNLGMSSLLLSLLIPGKNTKNYSDKRLVFFGCRVIENCVYCQPEYSFE